MLTAEQKARVRHFSAEYDRLYSLADRLFRQHDPCKFDSEGRCAASRDREIYVKDDGEPIKSCCHYGSKPCRNLGPSGCTIKSIGCKLWFWCGKSYRDEYGRMVRKLRDIEADFDMLYDGLSGIRVNSCYAPKWAYVRNYVYLLKKRQEIAERYKATCAEKQVN